jgi:cytochrome P450
MARKARGGEASGDKAMMYGLQVEDNIKELPWWWDALFMLPFAQPTNPGEKINLGDQLQVMKTNIEQLVLGKESVDGAPVATGDLPALAPGLSDGTLFLGLQKFQDKFGGIFKLCFGPRSFLVASDPAIFKHLLRGNALNYNKGLLEECVEDLWGTGIITADFEIWKPRRKAIVPGFTKAWLKYQVGEFGVTTERYLAGMRWAAKRNNVIDFEEYAGGIALEVITKCIFNFNFESGSAEVVKDSMSAFKEVEHRVQSPIPYWNLPFMSALAEKLSGRQMDFKENLKHLNMVVDECIEAALADRSEKDADALKDLDYGKLANPSMIRLLVDLKGESTTGKQIRDDAITLLVAGHQTTQSALTWAIIELIQQPELLKQVQEEIDSVLGDKTEPTYEDIEKLELVRLVVAETLRMYPVPTVLIRRALDEDTLPAGGTGVEVKVKRGVDLMLNTYAMHRDEKYWPNPNKFDPMRWKKAYKNPAVPSWEGYDPEKCKSSLYPNEIASDYAFVPFGGGVRKCPGDIFSMLETTVILAMILREFNFDLQVPAESLEPVSAATLNTANGVPMKLTPRKRT